MKNGFKLFLSVCFIFTFVFSLAFAGPGDPPPAGCPTPCCIIDANTNCTAGMGHFEKVDQVCVCVPWYACPPPPQCF